MGQAATHDDDALAWVEPGRALTVLTQIDQDAPRIRHPGRRPAASFLAHLLASHDPTLQSSRLARTQSAAARYAAVARSV